MTRAAAASTKDAAASRRMLALPLVLEGQNRTEAARAAGMDRQILRDWVHRYNAQGLQGLTNRPNRGAPKRKLTEAGFQDGFDTELYVYNTDPNPRIAQAIQQDLKAIGINAEIRSLAEANVIAAGGEKDQAPMIWSGGMAWVAGFPDPSDFYGPILGCGGAVSGGWNWSWYCSEGLDAKADEANAIVDPDRSEERVEIWRDVYLAVMKDAP